MFMPKSDPRRKETASPRNPSLALQREHNLVAGNQRQEMLKSENQLTCRQKFRNFSVEFVLLIAQFPVVLISRFCSFLTEFLPSSGKDLFPARTLSEKTLFEPWGLGLV
jgi:hypothetical protein